MSEPRDEETRTEDDPQPQPGEAGGTVWDAPNQQVVRADGSAPWDEGTGGAGDEQPVQQQTERETADAEPEPPPSPAARSAPKPRGRPRRDDDD